jgi:hypothetical protein
LRHHPRGDHEQARIADHLQRESATVARARDEGKFVAKSGGWDEDRVFLEGDKLEVTVVNGRWVLTHLPAAPRPMPMIQHYFPTE